MSVARICLREVDIAALAESVVDAARRMRDQGVGTLVVVDEVGRPVGLLTDRDLAVRVLADAADPRAVSVGDVMTRNPRTVSEGTPIESALALMASGAFRRLPVVNEDGRLVGILSLDDLLGLLAEEFALIGRLLGYDIASDTPVDEIWRIAPRPVLIVHGDADGLVPLSDARQLQAAGPSAELWVVGGAGHGGSYGTNPQAYTERVANFFARHLGVKG